MNFFNKSIVALALIGASSCLMAKPTIAILATGGTIAGAGTDRKSVV